MSYKNILKILILLMIIVLSATCVSAGLFGNNNNNNALKGSGHYKVGQDIPAGEYYIKCTGSNLYVEIASDSSGSLGSIISNLNTNGGVYVTVKEGEYLNVNGGNIYEINKSPNKGAENGYYKEGMYKVGQDIPAGEYNVEATSGLAYIEVDSDSRHTIESIISNDNFENNKIISVSDGQYLLLNNGARIKV